MAAIGKPGVGTAGCAALLALAMLPLATGAPAQPFGFLFDDGRDPGPPRGTAGPRRGAPHARRGAQPAAQPRRVPQQVEVPQQAEVPLPEPRPHFAGDPPRRDRDAIGAAAEAKPVEAKPAEPKPVDAKPADAKTAEGMPAEGTPAATKAAEAKPAEGKPAEGKPPEPAAALPAVPPLPAPKPPELAEGKPGQAGTPAQEKAAAVAPSGATTAVSPRQPDADPGCPARLAAAKVEAEAISLPPQPDPRCTVAEPVRLASLSLPDGGTVSFPDRPTLSCTTAATFASYVGELLAPLAKGTFADGTSAKEKAGTLAGKAAAGAAAQASALVAVWTGPGLECRSRDHIFGAKLSAHGQGLAVDIAQIKLADGRVIPVGLSDKPSSDKPPSDKPEDAAVQRFEAAARAGACGYFHTVLGPGSDSYHRTHWHFDLEVRGREGDTKYCH